MQDDNSNSMAGPVSQAGSCQAGPARSSCMWRRPRDDLELAPGLLCLDSGDCDYWRELKTVDTKTPASTWLGERADLQKSVCLLSMHWKYAHWKYAHWKYYCTLHATQG